jgi:nucleotide-binding universal stress UspA family protein
MTIYSKMRISNPSPYFETPNQVLRDEKLSSDDKEKVLRSMVLDADLAIEATAEGMAVGNLLYSSKDLQSALIQLEKIKEAETVESIDLQTARFQRIMVVTTVDQDLNRKIVGFAYDMAEVTGGKVFLLNVVPSQFEGAGLVAAGQIGTTIPIVVADNAQMIEDRGQQLAELRVESGSNVETEIEVRGGDVEKVIIDYADDCDADVIVVGSPNRSWLETLFDSSIARRVTKSAPCPVLVVPEAA